MRLAIWLAIALLLEACTPTEEISIDPWHEEAESRKAVKALHWATSNQLGDVAIRVVVDTHGAGDCSSYFNVNQFTHESMRFIHRYSFEGYSFTSMQAQYQRSYFLNVGPLGISESTDSSGRAWTHGGGSIASDEQVSLLWLLKGVVPRDPTVPPLHPEYSFTLSIECSSPFRVIEAKASHNLTLLLGHQFPSSDSSIAVGGDLSGAAILGAQISKYLDNDNAELLVGCGLMCAGRIHVTTPKNELNLTGTEALSYLPDGPGLYEVQADYYSAAYDEMFAAFYTFDYPLESFVDQVPESLVTD